MPEQILINFTPQETRVAVLQQGVTQEIHIERTSSRGLVGNVYWARSCASCPACSRPSSMSASNARPSACRRHHGSAPQRSRQRTDTADRAHPLRRPEPDGAGDQDPIGTKGARLSTQISIAGRMLVHLPQEKHIGVSQRIEDEGEREALREKLTRLVPGDEPGGFIVRTMAEGASDGDLANDIAYLRKIWAELKVKARTTAPALIYQELNLAQRVLRDFVNPETARIVLDSRENFTKLASFAEIYTPAVRACSSTTPARAAVRPVRCRGRDPEGAGAPCRPLKSGGYLIFDQTEAMTTIDVNTGGFVGVRNFDDTIFKTNLEAAQTIARQLRLRNLGGIIIIDFIDMDTAEHRDAVLAEFNGAGARPHAPDGQRLHRARPRRDDAQAHLESLAHVLCEPRPTCDGRGEVKTARTVCYEILRELLREARQFNAREYRVIGAPSVIDLFLDEESRGPGDALRLHREAGLAAGRTQLFAGTVRHRADVMKTGPRPVFSSGTLCLRRLDNRAGTLRDTGVTDTDLPQIAHRLLHLFVRRLEAEGFLHDVEGILSADRLEPRDLRRPAPSNGDTKASTGAIG